MTKHEDPAFPTRGDVQYYGMTLRQYAAIKAMQGLLASDVNNSITIEGIVQCAVATADALLLELDREEKENEN